MLQQRLQELKNIFNFTVKQVIRNQFNDFSKAAVDTGLMLDTTELVSLSFNIEELTVSLNIKSQEYLKYVEAGAGGNRNYGPREIRNVAINHPDVQAAINNVYDEMLKEYLKIDTTGIRNIKINL